jgi:hypothetical protein
MREWQATRTISMSVQTVELQMIGTPRRPQLMIASSLMSIARGTCNLKVSTHISHIVHEIGQLHIETTRPVMHGEIALPIDDFSALKEGLSRSLPRPASLVLALAQNLHVSVEGDLAIDKEQVIPILDISWNIPLQ